MSRAPRGLFGDGAAVVLGLPAGFDLCASIRNASEIRLATAFAHLSGWKLISDAVLAGHASCRLLTGLDFCQTEPALLKAWIALMKNPCAIAKLHKGKGVTFHPKVLIVSSPRRSFAIVGSGNLSAGGFRDNVECSVFVDAGTVLNTLRAWFDGLFEDQNATKQLTEEDVKDYEPKFKKARKHNLVIRKSQRQVEASLGERHTSELVRWEAAIREARNFFASSFFRDWYPERKAAVAEISDALRYPVFNFSRQDWYAFFGMADLGRLRQAWKIRLWTHRAMVRRAFRKLVDDTLAPADRLSAVLDPQGNFHVDGLGPNIVSKVLAVHRPELWPVYNQPVAQALKAFKYRPPRGLSASGKYLAFAELMRKFMTESGAPDMPALDCFFYWYAKDRGKAM